MKEDHLIKVEKQKMEPKIKKNKKNKNRCKSTKSNRNSKTVNPVEEINEHSKDLAPRALIEAAKRLKDSFNKIDKSLFSAKIPAPYVRSDSSRPLHFTKDGLHLMYFRETEFIKLNLKTSKIVFRRKIGRADLSPIYMDYKIWSQDDSKVLVLKNDRITPNKVSEVFVYNVHNGEYLEISEAIRALFMQRKGPEEIYIDCFNPVNNHEIILRQIKGGSSERARILHHYRPEAQNRISESILSWNYKNRSTRVIEKDLKPSGSHVFPVRQYLVVLRLIQKGRHFANDLTAASITVYQAKGYKKILEIKKPMGLPLLHARSLYISSSSFRLKSAYCHNRSYELLLTYNDQRFYTIDFFQRKSSNFTQKEASRNRYQYYNAVFPTHLIQNTSFVYDWMFNLNGFTLLVPRNHHYLYKVVDNYINILEESQLVVMITAGYSNSQKRFLVDVYDLKDFSPRTQNSAEKKKKRAEKTEESSFESHSPIPMIQINFSLINYQIDPFSSGKRLRISQPYRDSLNILEYQIFNSSSFKGWDVYHKVIDTTSWKLDSFRIFSGGIEPEANWGYTNNRTSLDKLQEKAPKPYHIILNSWVQHDYKNKKYPIFLIYDLRKKKLVAWRGSSNLFTDTDLEVGYMCTHQEELEDVNGVMILTDSTAEFYQVDAAITCEYLDLEKMSTSKFLVKLEKDMYERIQGVVGLSRLILEKNDDRIRSGHGSSSPEDQEPVQIPELVFLVRSKTIRDDSSPQRRLPLMLYYGKLRDFEKQRKHSNVKNAKHQGRLCHTKFLNREGAWSRFKFSENKNSLLCLSFDHY